MDYTHDRHVLLYCIIFLTFVSTSVALEPAFGNTVKDIKSSRGKNITLPCTVSNLGDQSHVMWMHEDSTLLTFDTWRIVDDERFRIERDQLDSWNLRITDASPNMNGVYTCQINTQPVPVHRVRLAVLDPPRIIEYSLENTVNYGDNVTLTCIATGTPQPSITWFRGYEVLKRGDTLTIENITEEDTEYECKADNNVNPMTFAPFRVDIHTPPKVEALFERVYQTIGQYAVLECYVSGNPDPDVMWVKDGIELSQSRRFKQEIQRSYDRILLTLEIQNLSVDDFGIYLCSAENSKGRNSSEVQLYDVNAKLIPRFTDTKQTIFAKLGFRTSLPCSFRNLHQYEVTWGNNESTLFKNSTRKTTDPRMMLWQPDGRTWNLNITNVTEQDAGEYHCSVNTEPVESRIVTLSVEDQDQDIIQATGDVTISLDGSVSLSCNTSGSPTTKVTWYRLFSELRAEVTRGNTLTLKSISPAEAGTYECEVSKGTDVVSRKKMKITVEFPPAMTDNGLKVGHRVGGTAVLDCLTKAVPEADITWLFGGKNLEMSDKYEVELYAPKKGVLSALRVLNITDEDFGVYTCKATNRLGQARLEMELYSVE